jgi:hypothetical protein
MDVRRLLTLIPLLMLAFVRLPTSLVIWYVAPTGDNDNNCLSESTPCKTIQAAIDRTLAGDIIFVAAGTYSTASNGETFPINITHSLSLHGDDPQTTIMDANGVDHNVINVNGCPLTVVIDQFTIRGGMRGIEVSGTDMSCLQGDIYDNKITANSIGIYKGPSNVKVWINDISGNGSYGIYNNATRGEISRNSIGWNGSGGSSAAIYNEHADVTIVNNVIGWNNGSGIENYHCNPNITNNTIAYNYGGSGIANWNSSGPALTNNIVVANGVYGIHQDETSYPTNSYNDVWGNAWGNYYGGAGGSGSISEDPSFVSAFDGHLRCSSPAINAGFESAPYVPVLDHDGNPRIVGGLIDMGAYEKQSELYCPVLLPVILR